MMEPERWQQVDRLLQAVLARPSEEWDAFLRDACADDEALERETRSLLTAHQQAGRFLESPALHVAALELASEQPGHAVSGTLPFVGRTVSHYRIVEQLGAGGMGVVYKAEDIRLHRFVALKFLSDDAAHAPGALLRVQLEARAISALNHTNICTIHDIGAHEGRFFIVMEHLEGETLRQRLSTGRLDLDTLLAVATDIVDGLDAAHAAGIVHRDIKPGNIFINRGNRAKILDFGLAQWDAPDRSEEPLTGAGTVLGTADYMSPEQARGQPLDARADLFAFGVVLHEMATGARPTAAARPAVDVPPALLRLIGKCLEPDRDRRIESAADIRTELQRLMEATASATATIPARSRWLAWKTIGAAAATLVAVAIGYVYFRPAPVLTDTDTVVVGDIANSTGEPVFDDMLRQGLSIQLRQSPFLSLVSDTRIQQQLRLMGRPADTLLTPALAGELCERNGSAVVINGTIGKLGNQYVLGLQARHCITGAVVDDQQAQAATKESVLNALSVMASSFRTRVGESIASVARHSTPLADATTTSLEALKAFSTARTLGFSVGGPGSASLLERAVALDPEFAMAHAMLGIVYSNLGESVRSMASTTKAYQLRDRASDLERFFIATMYDRQVSGNLDREQETLRAWAQTYPRDPDPYGLSAGFALTGTGQYERSVEASEKAIALDPDHGPAFASLAFGHLYLDRLQDAEEATRRASARRIDLPESLILRYFFAFLRGDGAEMDREAALATGKRGTEDWVAHVQALVLARSGQLQQARRMSRLAVDLAQQAGRNERAALFESAAAVWEGFFANTVAAREHATDALQLSTGRDVQYATAFALALSGDVSRSRALADDLDRRFPEDTSVRFNYLPVLRALFALTSHKPSEALVQLQAAERLDLAVVGVAFNGFFGALYPVYVRGLAYMAADQPVDAAKEFQRIIDHRGIVLGDPLDAMARLQLARAFAQAGNPPEAKAAYDNVLRLWKNADADMPMSIQANAEHLTLR